VAFSTYTWLIWQQSMLCAIQPKLLGIAENAESIDLASLIFYRPKQLSRVTEIFKLAAK
jgi:hypothetical protein